MSVEPRQAATSTKTIAQASIGRHTIAGYVGYWGVSYPSRQTCLGATKSWNQG